MSQTFLLLRTSEAGERMVGRRAGFERKRGGGRYYTTSITSLGRAAVIPMRRCGSIERSCSPVSQAFSSEIRQANSSAGFRRVIVVSFRPSQRGNRGHDQPDGWTGSENESDRRMCAPSHVSEGSPPSLARRMWLWLPRHYLAVLLVRCTE